MGGSLTERQQLHSEFNPGYWAGAQQGKYALKYVGKVQEDQCGFYLTTIA